MISSFDKALAAIITPIIVLLLTRVGLNVDAGTSEAITLVVTTLAVYLVPNKVATGQ